MRLSSLHHSLHGSLPNHGFNNINLYIELGDSLTEGIITEETGGLDTKYQAANRVIIYYKPDMTTADNGSWQLYRTRANPTINRAPGNTISGAPFTVGPDQAFVYGLDQSDLKKHLAVFKLGEGGSMLITRTGAANDWLKASGELYTTFINDFFSIGISKLYDAGYRRPTIKAVFVRLGTNDAATARWIQATFIAAVPLFVSQLRADLGSTSIPIYWVKVRTDLGVQSGFDTTSVAQVIDAISDCQAGGSTEISGFTMLDYDSDTTIDGVHQTEAASLNQGENEADLAIALGN